MLEALVLIGIAVTGCAILAAWYSGYADGGGGGSTLVDIGKRHCTLRVYAAENIGIDPHTGKSQNYVEAVLTNTGAAGIDGSVEIWVGGDHYHTNSTMTPARPLATGVHITYHDVSVRSTGIPTDRAEGRGYAAAAATYADGNRIMCERTWALASFAGGSG